MLIWGISFVATKVAVAVIPPYTLALLRFSISYAFLSLLSYGYIRKEENGYLNKKDYTHAVLAGISGITLNFLCENLGLTMTIPSNASFVISIAPLLTIIILDILYHRSPAMLEYLGSILSIVGIFFVIYNGKFDLEVRPMGDFIMLGAAFSWAIYTIFLDKIMDKYNVLWLTRKLTLYGLLAFIPFSVSEFSSHGMEYTKWFSTPVILSVLFLGLLASGVCYMTWNYAMKHAGTKFTTNFIYIIPFITVIFDVLILHNVPTFLMLLGGGLIVLGVYSANKSIRGSIKINIKNTPE